MLIIDSFSTRLDGPGSHLGDPAGSEIEGLVNDLLKAAEAGVFGLNWKEIVHGFVLSLDGGMTVEIKRYMSPAAGSPGTITLTRPDGLSCMYRPDPRSEDDRLIRLWECGESSFTLLRTAKEARSALRRLLHDSLDQPGNGGPETRMSSSCEVY